MNRHLSIISLLLFILLTSCQLHDQKYYIVNEGRGFDSIVLRKTTKPEIYKLFGTDYTQIVHNKYSVEDKYEKLGISFQHIRNNRKKEIEWINFDSNFNGKTAKGFDIKTMNVDDLLNIYGVPNWQFCTENDTIGFDYDDLGIVFYVAKIAQIPDSLPTHYFTNDIYANRMLMKYFRTVYGKSKIIGFTINTPSHSNTDRPNIGKSEVDSIFPIPISKKVVSRLDDRIRIKTPLGVSLSSGNQAFIEFEKYTQQYSCYCSDLNCIASANMKEDVAKIIHSWEDSDCVLKKVIIKKEVSLYVVEPKKLKLDDSRFWLKSVFVKNKDNTILRIDFVINSNGWFNVRNFQILTDELINSIEAGHKLLNTKPETISIKSHYRKIKINKPEGYVYSIQRGADFEVHKFDKLVHFNEPNSSIMIYRGNHPSYLYNQTEHPVVLEMRNGLLFGEKVEWNYGFKDKNKRFPYSLEAIGNFDKRDNVHVYLEVASTADLDLFKRTLPDTKFQ